MMTSWIIIGLVGANVCLAQVGIVAKNWKFSEKLKNDYIAAFYEARLEAEGSPSKIHKTAKRLCPHIEPLLKGTKNPAQQLAPLEVALCEEAVATKGLRCNGPNPNIGRTLLRAELLKACGL